MATSNPSSDTSSYTDSRNRFFHWVMRWFYNEPSPSQTEKQSTTPGFPALVNLLRAIGYDLKKEEILQGSHLLNTEFKIEITCPQTGRRAVLTTEKTKQEDLLPAHSVLPVIPAGVNYLAKEVVSQLVNMMDTRIIEDNGKDACIYPIPPFGTEIGPVSQTRRSSLIKSDFRRLQRQRSFDAVVSMGQKSRFSEMLSGLNQPKTPSMALEEIGMDVDDIVATMGGSNEALSSRPASPLLGGNTKTGLIRQKTWSLGSINDLEDHRTSTIAPPLTSSPISVGNDSFQESETDFLNRLNEIAAKIQELMLDVGKNKNVREKRSDLPSKTIVKQPSELKKTRLFEEQAGSMSRNASSSNFGTIQRTSSLKRLRSPVSASTKAATSSSFTPTETRRSPRIGSISSRQSSVTEKSLSTGRSTGSKTPDRSSGAIRKVTATKKENNTSPIVPILPRQRTQADAQNSRIIPRLSTSKSVASLPTSSASAVRSDVLNVTRSGSLRAPGTSSQKEELPTPTRRTSRLKTPSLINRFMK